jgi:hypothetical protein
MDLGFRTDPNLHRAQKRPIQSADRSTATVGGVGQSIRRTWKSGSMMSVTGTKKMMVENARGFRENRTSQLRNEAPLNCVSLRSQLEDEVTGEAVKGQDERPFWGALDSLPSHHRVDTARQRTSI